MLDNSLSMVNLMTSRLSSLSGVPGQLFADITMSSFFNSPDATSLMKAVW